MADRETLAGHVVVVAGASSGMGRATALAAAAQGATVVVAARNAAALHELTTAIVAAGGTATAVPTDATDPEAVRHLVATARSTHGHIDALINSVGLNIKGRALDQLTVERWNSMVAANLDAAYYLTAAIVPVFREQHGGLLIHISSIAARRPDRSGVAYQATKAGVAALAHGTMEEEREHGLRTTVIYPGLTDTPLVQQRPVPPMPEMLALALRPGDVAAACLYVLQQPARVHIPEIVLLPARSL